MEPNNEQWNRLMEEVHQLRLDLELAEDQAEFQAWVDYHIMSQASYAARRTAIDL